MTVYYVKYRWGDDEWRVDSTFPDYDSAQAYVESQVTQARAGVAGSLNGYDLDDFVITTSPKITYWLNWMGPISHDWIAKNGMEWSAGRMDVHGTGEPYPVEWGVPAMKSSDWISLREWLKNFATFELCSLSEIIKQYEETNPKITWFKKGE